MTKETEKKDLTGIFELELTPEVSPPQALPATADLGITNGSEKKDEDFGFPAELSDPIDQRLTDIVESDPPFLASGHDSPSDEIHTPVEMKLWISGKFEARHRELLLKFLSSQQGPLSSDLLDLQIESNQVFIPRLTEFEAIKLAQDLRDAPLNFKWAPAWAEESDPVENAQNASETDLFQESSLSPIEEKSHVEVYPTLEQGQRAGLLAVEMISTVHVVSFPVLDFEESPEWTAFYSKCLRQIQAKAKIMGGAGIAEVTHHIQLISPPQLFEVKLTAWLLLARS